MSWLQEIPLEILVHILSFCDVYDTIAIRGCCRLFQTITHDSQVWTNQLENTCSSWGVSPVEFGVKTVNSKAQENTATRVHRLYSRMGHEAFLLDPIQPQSCAMFTSAQPWRAISMGFGGKWIAAVCGSILSILEIDDNLASSQKPRILATQTVELDMESRLNLYWEPIYSNTTFLEIREALPNTDDVRLWVFEVSNATMLIAPLGKIILQSGVYLIYDAPSSPILSSGFGASPAPTFLWFPRVNRTVPIVKFGSSDDIVFASRGIICRLGRTQQGLSVWKYPRHIDPHTTTNVTPDRIAQFHFADEVDDIDELLAINCSSPALHHPFSPLDATSPVMEFMLLLQMSGKPPLLIRKALFVDPASFVASWITVGTYLASNFPSLAASASCPSLPYLSANKDSWFLNWLPEDCGDYETRGLYVYGSLEGRKARGALLTSHLTLSKEEGAHVKVPEFSFGNYHFEVLSTRAAIRFANELVVLEYAEKMI
ncbi:hypothetical protein DL96DRAFT_1822114 [Flagelloscypha sp. PMI_526]|nr:hypothetical protein DL96DRAFT_1822114 [Flagelloscypha sp. PMI_526]